MTLVLVQSVEVVLEGGGLVPELDQADRPAEGEEHEAAEAEGVDHEAAEGVEHEAAEGVEHDAAEGVRR